MTLSFARDFPDNKIALSLADPAKRKRTRKRLLKVEQIHQLARDIPYGNQGRLKGKVWKILIVLAIAQPLFLPALFTGRQKRSAGLSKNTHDPKAAGMTILFLAHISPIAWSNVILYGDLPIVIADRRLSLWLLSGLPLCAPG